MSKVRPAVIETALKGLRRDVGDLSCCHIHYGRAAGSGPVAAWDPKGWFVGRLAAALVLDKISVLRNLYSHSMSATVSPDTGAGVYKAIGKRWARGPIRPQGAVRRRNADPLPYGDGATRWATRPFIP